MWDHLCSKGGSSVWHGHHRYTLTYSYFEIIRNNAFSSNPRHVWQHGWGCVFASISYMCVCKICVNNLGWPLTCVLPLGDVGVSCTCWLSLWSLLSNQASWLNWSTVFCIVQNSIKQGLLCTRDWEPPEELSAFPQQGAGSKLSSVGIIVSLRRSRR